jgi:soluble lytic murein transglycosylase-like protein
MRCVLATLALAGVLCAAPAKADQWAERLAFMSADDVARAVRCAPPKICSRAKPRRPPGDRAHMLAMIDAAAIAAGIPPRLGRALVAVESGFDPGKRGRAGEWGLTQIKCRTAQGLGLRGPCEQLGGVAINLRWGFEHAARALRRGSIGFHQAGLYARRVSPAYVAKINRAMGAL